MELREILTTQNTDMGQIINTQDVHQTQLKGNRKTMDQLAKQMGTITNKYEQIKMFVGFDEDEPEDLTGNIPHM